MQYIAALCNAIPYFPNCNVLTHPIVTPKKTRPPRPISTAVKRSTMVLSPFGVVGDTVNSHVDLQWSRWPVLSFGKPMPSHPTPTDMSLTRANNFDGGFGPAGATHKYFTKSCFRNYWSFMRNLPQPQGHLFPHTSVNVIIIELGACVKHIINIFLNFNSLPPHKPPIF